MNEETLTTGWQVESEIRARLISAANSVRICSVEEAIEMCFLSTMEFVIACAIVNSIELPVIKWEVTDNPDFHEHWAIAVSMEEVIDITRTKVDGSTNVLNRLDSYPRNYRKMKFYPSSILLRTSLFARPHLDAIGAVSAMKIRWECFVLI